MQACCGYQNVSDLNDVDPSCDFEGTAAPAEDGTEQGSKDLKHVDREDNDPVDRTLNQQPLPARIGAKHNNGRGKARTRPALRSAEKPTCCAALRAYD